MVKIKLWRIFCSLFVVIFCTLLACRTQPNIPLDKINVEAEYYDNGLIGGVLDIKYQKRYPTQESALFSVYPNINSPNLEKPLKIVSINCDGKIADYRFLDEQKTTLSVSLDNKKTACSVKIKFLLQLDNKNERLAFTDKTVSLGNWLILPCAYIDKKFVLPVNACVGDPFVTECADFNVRLTVPSTFTVAASATPSSLDVAGDKTTYIYAQKKVRDFCFVLSEDYSVDRIVISNSDKTLGVNDSATETQKAAYRSINYYFYGDIDSQSVLKLAKKALLYFSKIYGEYPYESLSICHTPLNAGGMEYPALCMVSDGLSASDYAHALVHEIAHQWWYAVVGTNQIESPFIDEGLAELSTALFFEAHPDYGVSYDLLRERAKSAVTKYGEVYFALNKKPDLALNKVLTDFKGINDYVAICYKQSFLAFDSAKNAIGEKKLVKYLSSIYYQYAYQIITAEKLFNSLGGARPIMEGYFNGV